MVRGQVTISTHNGSSVSFGHNQRIPEIVLGEPHIDPNGKHENWVNRNLRDVYNQVFQPAADAYDQTARKSRRVGNYLDRITQEAIEGDADNDKIRERNKEHKEKGEPLERLRPVPKPCYEMIVGVYPQGDLRLTEQEQYEILRLWFYGDDTPEHPSFKERNPSIEVVGCYYHADEPGAEPHLHLDYVPVGQYTRGMSVQNSLERAFNQQGIKSGKVPGPGGKERLMTAQEQFQEQENAHLQAICEDADLEVIRPGRGKKSRHLSTAEKKRQTAAEKLVENAKAEAGCIIQQARMDAEAERQRILSGLSNSERERLDYLEGFMVHCDGIRLKDDRTAGYFIRKWTADYDKSLEQTGAVKPTEQEQVKTGPGVPGRIWGEAQPTKVSETMTGLMGRIRSDSVARSQDHRQGSSMAEDIKQPQHQGGSGYVDGYIV